MSNVKYSLRQENMRFAVGTTDLRNSRGSLIDTNGCLALFVISGFAIATVNLKKRILRQGDFILLFYDGTFSIDRQSAMFFVRFISLAYSLLEEAIYKPLSYNFWEFIFEYPVFRTTDEQKDLLNGWWCQIKWISRIENETSQEEMLKNSIRNLLVATDTEITRATVSSGDTNTPNHVWMLIIRFLKLVSLHYREIREVQFYADQLSITTTYLYKICKKNMKLTPKELLDRQTVTEIKTYLVNTDISVKRIANELHFEDVSYMCRYFKRLTGTSPLDYRKSIK